MLEKIIAEAVKRAEEKHGPMTAERPLQLMYCTEELGEAAQAAQDHPEYYLPEMVDLLAVVVRIIKKELEG